MTTRKYDVIGDIHGHAEVLRRLLRAMDYREDGRVCEEWIETGELVIVPRGVEHRPFAEQEAEVLLFEPASTLNTGNVSDTFTRKNLEQI